MPSSIERPLPACIIGVDEAGRGPWAGPVVAAAVWFPEDQPVPGLNDSKQCSAAQRARLRPVIENLPHGIGSASVEEIDTLNIRIATFLAMERAVAALFHAHPNTQGTCVLVDGNAVPPHQPTWHWWIRGDVEIPAIAAASILAKTTRDAWMQQLDVLYPHYGFAQHKGYGTKAHREALEQFGTSPIHRQSFAPVRRYPPKA